MIPVCSDTCRQWYPWHKEGSPRWCRTLLLGSKQCFGPRELERWSLQPCPEEAPGVPKHPHGVQHLEANPVPPMPYPQEACAHEYGVEPGACSPAWLSRDDSPSRVPTAPVASSQEGFGVAAGSRDTQPRALIFWCVPAGLLAGWDGDRWWCFSFSWQQVRTLLSGGHEWMGGIRSAFSPQHLLRILRGQLGPLEQLPTPLAPWRLIGNLAIPGQGRVGRGQWE